MAADVTPVRVRAQRVTTALPPATLAGIVAALIAVALIAGVTNRALSAREEAANRVSRTADFLAQLNEALAALVDAETGQRGYLLTRDERYLEPYNVARSEVPAQLSALRASATADTTSRLQHLEQLSAEKLDELSDTIELLQTGKAEDALSIVRSDRGRTTMDRIRSDIGEIRRVERAALAAYQSEWQDAVTLSSTVTWGGSLTLLLLISSAAVVMSRQHRARETEIWLEAGEAALGQRLQGEQRLDRLGAQVLEFLGTYLQSPAGALYVAEGPEQFRRVAGYAVPTEQLPNTIRRGDGLMGQAAKENRVLHVKEVPDGYLAVASTLGRAKAQELLIAPAVSDGVTQGVLELAFFRPVTPADRLLLTRVSESLGAAVRASKDRTRLEEFLEETQRQAEELQTQQEELRVTNEELEEQGRALREARARAESAQAELEQINTHLEEQTQLLEGQKDELERQSFVLQERTVELERANRYKSEFVANMSHELRTPLNSALILARLLADNKGGNLTAEQVKFAETIAAAGKDLLGLINDILDLAKIEAGKMDVVAAPLTVEPLLESLVKGFMPVANDKRLALSSSIAPGTPREIRTDVQRVGQILRNLLSNALKFTDVGTVSVAVAALSADTVAFTVTDTGIGIRDDQQELVFEAFRQADGSAQRSHGGTGLGLSISRDLARLLGGDLTVRSAVGEGSVFTLTLPVAYTAPAATDVPAAAREPKAVAAMPPSAAAAPPQTAPAVVDDRRDLRANTRLILVIEDDVRFAAILQDMAHERGFQCVVAHSADDGLAAAVRYHPSAILLDVNLPDRSGLAVLEQLKRQSETRHVPVHIISVADHAREALARGAVGYELKPVSREQLGTAFDQLQSRITQRMRRVLIVEDDERQRESLCHLLEHDTVELTAVPTAAAALTELRRTTFDCMVIDLGLPDMSGFELLETMAGRDDVSFPPVIVYSGRVLSADEEHALLRHSQSIIVKDARSPERLLDEVTLFLHQVESTLPLERQRMLQLARTREAALEGRRILVVEDDARNIFALASVLEPRGVQIDIARNGREAIEALARSRTVTDGAIDLVLMDIMMPEMDGLTAMREIRRIPEWKKLPIIALTAKAMQDDQEACLAAGANDYIAKPLDVERLLSLIRVWLPQRGFPR